MTTSLFRLYDATEAGADGYPPEWHATIKHLVREQAGDRCVRCKHPYKKGEHGRGEWTPCDEQCTHKGPFRYRQDGWGDWQSSYEALPKAGNVVAEAYQVEAQWRILTVHHLAGPGSELDCRWFNLVALCQRCHLSVQSRVHLDRPYFLEHSHWIKPYVAGFYAATILGEDLTREQTVARLDELLSLATSESRP